MDERIDCGLIGSCGCPKVVAARCWGEEVSETGGKDALLNTGDE